MSEMQSTIGDSADASLVVINRNGGREQLFKSRSYLIGIYLNCKVRVFQMGLLTCTSTDE